MYKVIFLRAIFTVLFLLTFTFFPFNTAFAQLFEDFEEGSKNSYTASTVELNSGVWFLNDALIGSSTGDRFNDSKSVRLRDGYIEMQFDNYDRVKSKKIIPIK